MKDKCGAKYSRVAELIREGKSLYEVDEEYPEVVLMHHKKLSEYVNFTECKKLTQRVMKPGDLVFRPTDPDETQSVENFEIRYWLETNLFVRDRPPKTKNLWIWGAPSLGKSLLRHKLALAGVRQFLVPMQEEWFDGYADGCYDLLVFEEFCGQKPVTSVNGMCDGYPWKYKVKSMSAKTKYDNLPVLVLSNYSPLDSYLKVDHQRLKGLEERFEVVHVTEFIAIEVEKKEEEPSIGNISEPDHIHDNC